MNFWRYHYTKDFEADDDGEVKDGFYKCIERMVPDLKTEDEIHSKLLQFNESMGSFGLSISIRGRSKDPPCKKFQSFQIIYNIIESFQSHLLKFFCIQLFLQPIGRDNLVGTALSCKSFQFRFWSNHAMLLDVNAIGVFFSVYTPRSETVWNTNDWMIWSMFSTIWGWGVTSCWTRPQHQAP